MKNSTLFAVGVWPVTALLTVQATTGSRGFIAGSAAHPLLLDDERRGLQAYSRLLREFPLVANTIGGAQETMFHADGVPMSRQEHPHGFVLAHGTWPYIQF